MMTLDDLNTVDAAGFNAVLDGIFENAPWIATAAASARPFSSLGDLHAALMKSWQSAPHEQQLAFLLGHPDLSPAALVDFSVSEHSRNEQAGLGFAALGERIDEFAAGISAYRARFGFPFIICVRRHTAVSVLNTLNKRLNNSQSAEWHTAQDEIGFITRLRLVERIQGPGAPRVYGHLSTHVLDTSMGRPGAGIRVVLMRENQMIRDAVTDNDGRLPGALIEHEPLRIGQYALHFDVGPYFAGRPGVDEPPWYDVIPVRFAITAAEGHYHIPLLVSPWTYTTYRGS